MIKERHLRPGRPIAKVACELPSFGLSKQVDLGDYFSISTPRIRPGEGSIRFKCGKVIILSNENFTNTRYDDRKGNKNDLDALKRTFKRFNCDIDILSDLTASEIKEEFCRRAEKDDYSEFDFVTVVLMSHGDRIGNQDMVIGSDGKMVPNSANGVPNQKLMLTMILTCVFLVMCQHMKLMILNR